MAERLRGTPNARGHEALAKAITSEPPVLPTLGTVRAVLAALRASRATVAEWATRHDLDYRRYVEEAGRGHQRDRATRRLGSPAPVWSVPVARRTPFTGRSADLLHLAHAFDAGPHPVVIHGLPGMGKTQLAAHFAHFAASRYELVWWIHADSVRQARADLAALGQRVAGSGGRPDEVLVDEAARYLRRHANYLLIADGATDLALFAEVIPDAGGHLLVTTNAANFEHIGRLWHIRPIDRPASTLLLTGRGRGGRDVAPLVRAIGGVPLVLQQARAFVELTGSTYADYHQRLEEATQRTLTNSPVPSDYPRTAAAAWDLALGEARERSATAPALLTMLAFCAEAPLPSSIVLASRTRGGTLDRDRAAALAVLARLALINTHRGTITVHGLLAAMLRDQDRPAVAGLRALLPHLDRSLPVASEQLAHRRVWAAALPHVLAACDAYDDDNPRDARVRAHLLNRAATYLQARGRRSDALGLFRRALALTERCLGTDGQMYWSYRNDLALAERHEPDADLDRIIGVFEELLNVHRADLDAPYEDADDHSNRQRPGAQRRRNHADALHNLGGTLLAAGRPDDALPLLQAAIDEYEALWPAGQERERHPELARAYTNLAWACIDAGDRASGEAASRTALALTESSARRQDAERACALGDLGVALEGTRPGESAGLHRQAAAIWKRIHGSRSERRLKAVLNEGGALRSHGRSTSDLGSVARAIRLHREVMYIAGEEKLAAMYDSAQENLGLDLRTKALILEGGETVSAGERGRIRKLFVESAGHLNAVLERRDKRLPRTHHLVVRSLKNVGAVTRDQGRPRDAIRYFDQALDRLDDEANLARVYVLDHRALAYAMAHDAPAARRDGELALRLLGDNPDPALVPLRLRFQAQLRQGES